MTETLQFRTAAEPPDVTTRVYAETTSELLGAPVTFRVIGNSHVVAAPGLSYHEISSCEPVPGGEAVPLRPEAAPRRLRHETDAVATETLIEPEPLAAFPDDRTFTLEHRFAERAVTAIDCRESGFETYHTYPEHDLSVYSRTTFHRVPTTPDPAPQS